MKTLTLILVVAALSCPGAVLAEGRGGGWGGGRGGARPTAHSSVAIKMRRVAVPHPERIQKAGNFVRDDRHVAYPTRDGHNAPIRAQEVRANPNHAMVTRNPAVMHDIFAQQRSERAPGRYYWHTANRFRYVHFYDDHHVHWYGFYRGSQFYWTRWWGNHWWWWDPGFDRWVFWYNGYWWWQGPQGGIYVYVENNYYPYEEAQSVVTVKTPEVQAPPAIGVPEVGQGQVFKSADGSRMVQVSGDGSAAFLYDNTGSEPVFMKYLAKNVAGVRFSGGSGARPVEILVDFKDGSFGLFDAQGQPLDAQPAQSQSVQSEPVQPQPQSAPESDQAPSSGELPGPPPSVPSAPPASEAPPQPPPAQ